MTALPRNAPRSALEFVAALCLGLALAASAGLRVFVALLAAALRG